MKILLLTNKPIHYRLDLFDHLFREYGCDISFHFISKDVGKIGSRYPRRPYQESSFYYGQKNVLIRYFKYMINLIKIRPEVIISGGLSTVTIINIIYSWLFSGDNVIWWAGTVESESNISIIKKIYRKAVVLSISDYICYSQYAADYISSIKGHDSHIFIAGNNTMDCVEYQRKVSEIRKKNTGERSIVTILCASQLIKRKNIIMLILAIQCLNELYENIKLEVAGAGQEKRGLEEYCRNNRIDNVRFIGYVEPEQLIKYYADSDIFVIPSLSDRWPQTYNESSASALPVLISTAAGVQDKYTDSNRSIVLFEPDNVDHLVKSLSALIEDRELRLSIGSMALNNALSNDVKKAVKVFSECVRNIKEKRGRNN